MIRHLIHHLLFLLSIYICSSKAFLFHATDRAVSSNWNVILSSKYYHHLPKEDRTRVSLNFHRLHSWNNNNHNNNGNLSRRRFFPRSFFFKFSDGFVSRLNHLYIHDTNHGNEEHNLAESQIQTTFPNIPSISFTSSSFTATPANVTGLSSSIPSLSVAETSITTATATLTNTLSLGPEKKLVLSPEGNALSADDILKVGGNSKNPIIVEKLAPPLTFKKYLTMQEKRVKVIIRYSNVPGLRPFYLTMATFIKNKNPDVVIEKEVIPVVGEDSEEEPIFEVIIDGKVVVGKSRCNWQPVSRSSRRNSSSNSNSKNSISNEKGTGDGNNLANGMSVFIPVEEVNVAIVKARRRRRPTTTVYAQSIEANDGKTSVRLEMKKRGTSRREIKLDDASAKEGK